MPIVICPECGKKLNVSEQYVGQWGKCKGCGKRFQAFAPPENYSTEVDEVGRRKSRDTSPLGESTEEKVIVQQSVTLEGEDKPTEKQLQFLKNLGVRKMPSTKKQASRLIDKALSDDAPPSDPQLNLLKELGVVEIPVSRLHASQLIDRARLIPPPTEQQLNRLKELGITEKPTSQLSASILIDRAVPPTKEQLNRLKELNVEETPTSKCRASELINEALPLSELQLRLLKELGVTEKPSSRMHAAILIKEARENVAQHDDPPDEEQIEYLRRIGYEEDISTSAEADEIICECEEQISELIRQSFPLIDICSFLPDDLEENIFRALKESDCIREIHSGKKITLKKLREIIEPAIGETLFGFINRRGDDRIDAFEEKCTLSRFYLEGFLEAYHIKTDEVPLDKWLLQLWMVGIGAKMASTYNRWEDSGTNIPPDNFRKNTELNKAISAQLMSGGVTLRGNTGCLSMIILCVFSACVMSIMMLR